MMTPTILKGDQPVISIWLSNENSEDIKKFHCVVCGKICFEYYNDIRMIVPGNPGYLKSPTVVECKGAITVQKNGRGITTRCKTKYFIT